MKVTQADIAEYEGEGFEVRRETDRNGEMLHILYKNGEPSGTCLDWLPEHHSLPARQARQTAHDAARQRGEAARAARQAERTTDREAG